MLFGFGPNSSIEVGASKVGQVGAKVHAACGTGFLGKGVKFGPNIAIECFSTDWDHTSAGGGPRAVNLPPIVPDALTRPTKPSGPLGERAPSAPLGPMVAIGMIPKLFRMGCCPEVRNQFA